MDNYLRNKLSQQCKMQKCFNASDCLKLTYQYNGIKVALYFDEYDEITCNLFLILSYGDYVYFAKLDIETLVTKNPYLEETPLAILEQIKKDESLQNFYDVMRDKIQNTELKKSSYNHQDFKQMANNSKKGDEVFFWTLRRANMQKDHFDFLQKKLKLSSHILQAVRNQGYTIVTTNDIHKRKKLIYILNHYKIKF
ncbi:hypothetical protein [Helicobacter bilis]|uniref:hypothetical protein n=1 Tax=Helicobacter bilis TaxID=37372 RepID=UPI0009847288|nr:hypothetical protein [Helicobacter bilis]